MTDFVLEFSTFKRSVLYFHDEPGNKGPGLDLKGCLRGSFPSAVTHLARR